MATVKERRLFRRFGRLSKLGKSYNDAVVTALIPIFDKASKDGVDLRDLLSVAQCAMSLHVALANAQKLFESRKRAK